jgi:hypothetical protein
MVGFHKVKKGTKTGWMKSYYRPKKAGHRKAKRLFKKAYHPRRGHVRFGMHRPHLIYSRKGWRRPKATLLMPRPVKVNPYRRHKRRKTYMTRRRHNPSIMRRRYSRARRSYRRNPSLPLNIDKVFIGGLKMAGGIAGGMLAMQMVGKFAPASIQKYQKFYGAIHILLGAAIAAFVKQKDVKDVGLVFAGLGVYDLIASNLPMLNLPPLPRNKGSAQIAQQAAGEPGIIGEDEGVPQIGSSYGSSYGSDYAPSAMGSSYNEMGDDISYGGDGGLDLD